jgi:hypothetical protein
MRSKFLMAPPALAQLTPVGAAAQRAALHLFRTAVLDCFAFGSQ